MSSDVALSAAFALTVVPVTLENATPCASSTAGNATVLARPRKPNSNPRIASTRATVLMWRKTGLPAIVQLRLHLLDAGERLPAGERAHERRKAAGKRQRQIGRQREHYGVQSCGTKR